MKKQLIQKIKEAMLESEDNKNDDFSAWEAQADKDIFSHDEEYWEDLTDTFININFEIW